MMTFGYTHGYTQPFSFQIGAPQVVEVTAIRHGVAEITLSDGRLAPAALHVKNVKPNFQELGNGSAASPPVLD